MIYFKNKDALLFYKDPSKFDKYTDKEILQYAIGANMYMPGNKQNVFEKLIDNAYNEVGSITLCCEDAIKETDLHDAEENILAILDNLYAASLNKAELLDTVPLIFIRVRCLEQFTRFSKCFAKEQLKFVAGFVFPKFSSSNGNSYLKVVEELAMKHDEVLYAMPILEGEELIYKENRFDELEKIHDILAGYSKYILNIRVGGTDFSSRFGLRRSMYHSIYDIRVVSDCLIDILNFFLRMESGYVVSAPVWEYFSYDEESQEIKGLKKELELDIQNGFYGKTIIHPTQINYVNERYVVEYDEYQDAVNILNAKGGVFKGSCGNRMNEVAPHTNWARKIVNRANVFGVLDKGASFDKKKEGR